MKRTYHIKMRAAIWSMLGIACLASAPTMAGEPAWWTQQKRDCGLPSNLAYNNWDGKCNSSSGGSTSAPSYDYGAAQRAREAEAERQRQQAEAERIERERQAEIKRQQDAAFIRDRDAAASSLKGSSGGALDQLKGIAGSDNSGLKGSGFDNSGSGLKELRGSGRDQKARSQPAPHTDTSVVDARHVPSGLWKGMDSAIVSAYANAPPGVSDRVRKGFQAVMERDWKVARAWFQDALNRDPGNASLKRLVALTEPVPPLSPSAVVDARNEPAGLGGKPEAQRANTPSDKTMPASASTNHPNLQLPDPNDMYIAFPGLKKLEDNYLMDILFGLDTQAPPPTTGGPKPAQEKSVPPHAQKELKPNWKAFFESLYKKPPKSKSPAVSAVRG